MRGGGGGGAFSASAPAMHGGVAVGDFRHRDAEPRAASAQRSLESGVAPDAIQRGKLRGAGSADGQAVRPRGTRRRQGAFVGARPLACFTSSLARRPSLAVQLCGHFRAIVSGGDSPGWVCSLVRRAA